MRYRSITLTDPELIFIKYENRYEKYLEEMKQLDDKLVSLVVKCPSIYSELSDHQSYMIFKGMFNCIGAIYIGTSTDEQDLEIDIQFIEEKFKNKEDITKVLEKIIDSLKFYCFDKKNIRIHLFNDIDLENTKYAKEQLFEDRTIYIAENSYYNSLYTKLFAEMKASLEEMDTSSKSWNQLEYVPNPPFNDNDIINEKLMEEYVNKTIPLNEIFYKPTSIYWENIDFKTFFTSMEFKRDGQVYFSKRIKGKDRFEFDYNVLKSGFVFKKSGDISLSVEKTDSYIHFKNDVLDIFKFNDNKKIIEYTSPVVNNSSIQVSLYVNGFGEIEKCYIDFRTHKKRDKYAGKITGTYALRIKSLYNECTLNFISRKGNISDSFESELYRDEEIYKAVFNGNLTIKFVDDIIRRLIPVIRRKESLKGNDFKLSNKTLSYQVLRLESESIRSLREIKDELMFPHLKEEINSFLGSYEPKTLDPQKKLIQS